MTTLIIPDTQVKEGVPLDHIAAAGNLIAKTQPETIIFIGDWWDMPSLSSYEKKGSKYFHGKSYQKDVKAGNDAMRLLWKATVEYNETRALFKKKKYSPRIIFMFGNHENRILRAVHEDPTREGSMGYKDLLIPKTAETYGFLEILDYEGILISHYLINPTSLIKSTVTGTIENKLKAVGKSFTMGHQQNLQYGVRVLPDGTVQHGLVVGAFYLHDEDYMSPQGNASHWRGLATLHNVEDGQFDIELTRIDKLVEQWG